MMTVLVLLTAVAFALLTIFLLIDWGYELLEERQGEDCQHPDEDGVNLDSLVIGQGMCPICGERVKEKPLRCKKCNTAYHRDCWEFNGGECGIYSCDSLRVVKSV